MKELFHPHRVGGFFLGLLIGGACIAAGIDQASNAPYRAWYSGQIVVDSPGP
jgi:hypothetical protein